VVQAIMRHAKMDMTLYSSHSRRKAKRASQEKVLQRLLPAEGRVRMRERDDTVARWWTGNLCIMMNLPHLVGA
jgi:hypothetical protein